MRGWRPATRSPEVVVELLNRFFAVVVDEVHAHGGWVNKFQGDATLVVFGAPVALDDTGGPGAGRGAGAGPPIAGRGAGAISGHRRGLR